jgi:hypothetical protein
LTWAKIFSDAGKYWLKTPNSGCVFSVAANEANLPRGVQIRARFLDGNTPVGDWSDHRHSADHPLINAQS